MLLSTRLARKITVYIHMKNDRAGISDKPQGPSVELVVFWSMMVTCWTVNQKWERLVPTAREITIYLCIYITYIYIYIHIYIYIYITDVNIKKH